MKCDGEVGGNLKRVERCRGPNRSAVLKWWQLEEFSPIETRQQVCRIEKMSYRKSRPDEKRSKLSDLTGGSSYVFDSNADPKEWLSNTSNSLPMRSRCKASRDGKATQECRYRQRLMHLSTKPVAFAKALSQEKAKTKDTGDRRDR